MNINHICFFGIIVGVAFDIGKDDDLDVNIEDDEAGFLVYYILLSSFCLSESDFLIPNFG